MNANRAAAGGFVLHARVLLAYAVVALAFSWPLPAHLSTHLTGPPGGDTGVYVWNQWVFHHEVVDNRTLPYFTDTIFGPRRSANLSLHNYTTFQNLLALPLVGSLGVVATFNVVYLLMTVLTGYCAFLLVRDITGSPGPAWLAGLLFAWSPVLATRGMGHFSLVAAAPLPVFLLLLRRAATRFRMRDALILGATVWWAASTDVYYAVYCVLIVSVFTIARLVTINRCHRSPALRVVPWTLNVLLLSIAGLIIALAISGGWRMTFLGRQVRMRSLYTPTLVLTVLVWLRAAWQYRISVGAVSSEQVRDFLREAVVAGVVATALLSPVLYGVGVLIAEGQFERPQIFWRSSPPGADLLALVAPNPNHPLVPAALSSWLASRPEGYLENVASIPWVALGVMLVAWRYRWRPSRCSLGLTIAFLLLTLGPFLVVGGINTHVPGPWALLRYAPIVGLARSPARFAVVMTLMAAVLFGVALTWLCARTLHRRRRVLVVVGGLLLFELCPAPRMLFSAAVPSIYAHVARGADGMTVLELPFGVRDGTSSVGNFTARTQFFQTMHGKPILGGYLSRVARRHVVEATADPVRNALLALSEKKTLTPEQERLLMEEGQSFATRMRVGFVVFDSGRASEEFRQLAIRAFRLELVETDPPYELYRPQ